MAQATVLGCAHQQTSQDDVEGVDECLGSTGAARKAGRHWEMGRHRRDSPESDKEPWTHGLLSCLSSGPITAYQVLECVDLFADD